MRLASTREQIEAWEESQVVKEYGLMRRTDEMMPGTS